MVRGWIQPNGAYYESPNQQDPADIEVPIRPTVYYDWNGTEWILNLARIQNAKWNSIKAERDRRSLYGGIKIGAHWVSSELIGRTRIISYALSGTSLPSGLEHPTMDNGSISVDQTIAADMHTALIENEAALDAAMKLHHEIMLALSDPSDYSFASGWPDTFSTI